MIDLFFSKIMLSLRSAYSLISNSFSLYTLRAAEDKKKTRRGQQRRDERWGAIWGWGGDLSFIWVDGGVSMCLVG